MMILTTEELIKKFRNNIHEYTEQYKVCNAIKSYHNLTIISLYGK